MREAGRKFLDMGGAGLHGGDKANLKCAKAPKLNTSIDKVKQDLISVKQILDF